MKSVEDPGPLPVLQASVCGRRRAAEFLWQVSPGDAGDQDEDDRAEDDSVVDPRPPTMWLRTLLGEQRLHHLPELIADLPDRLGHETSSDVVMSTPSASTPQVQALPEEVLRQPLREPIRRGFGFA